MLGADGHLSPRDHFPTPTDPRIPPNKLQPEEQLDLRGLRRNGS